MQSAPEYQFCILLMAIFAVPCIGIILPLAENSLAGSSLSICNILNFKCLAVYEFIIERLALVSTSVLTVFIPNFNEI